MLNEKSHQGFYIYRAQKYDLKKQNGSARCSRVVLSKMLVARKARFYSSSYSKNNRSARAHAGECAC